MMWMTGEDATLAVDLGVDAVRVVQVERGKGGGKVDFYAEQSVPEGTLANLPERQLGALKDLLGLQRVRTRRTIAALPTCLVLTRAVSVDRSKPGSAEEQIVQALRNCLPFDSADLVFDHWQVGESGPGRRNAEMMVVATQASVVEKYLAGFEKLRLRCAHLDVAPCAIAALLERTGRREGPVGTITVTRNNGFFAIIERGKVLFWRPFDLAVAEGGVPGMGGSIERIGEEVAKCISHMVGAMHIDNLSEMVLFGPGSDELVVNEYLKKRFQVPVVSPSMSEALPANGWAGSSEAKGMSGYCTALGLALQERIGGRTHG